MRLCEIKVALRSDPYRVATGRETRGTMMNQQSPDPTTSHRTGGISAWLRFLARAWLADRARPLRMLIGAGYEVGRLVSTRAPGAPRTARSEAPARP